MPVNNKLTTAVVEELINSLNVETTLPSPTIRQIVDDVLKGKSETDVVAAHSQTLEGRADDHTRFGSLPDIQTIAAYAVAIKTIYEVVVMLRDDQDIREGLAHLKKVANDVFKYLSETEVEAVLRRLWKSP